MKNNMDYLERSFPSLVNENLFTQYRNTIDIYTEDEEKDKQFYISLFSRLLEDTGVQINDITPLGGCEAVEMEWLITNDKRKKLFIIDGDIKVVMNPKEKKENLYVLERYCIENYLIQEEAFCKMYSDLSGIYTVEEIRKLIDINVYLLNYAQCVVPLFLHFAIVDGHNIKFEIPHVGRYCDTRTWEANKDKIYELIEKGWNDVGISKEELDRELSALNEAYPSNINTMLKVVRGKDIILYVRSRCSVIFKKSKKKDLQHINIPEKGWKAHLVRYVDLSALEGLKQAIIKASA